MVKTEEDYERVIKIRSQRLDEIRCDKYYKLTEQELVTVTVKCKGYTCTITQEYHHVAEAGHYKYCIINRLGDVVDGGCSIAGMPKGKIDKMLALQSIAKFLENRIEYMETMWKGYHDKKNQEQHGVYKP